MSAFSASSSATASSALGQTRVLISVWFSQKSRTMRGWSAGNGCGVSAIRPSPVTRNASRSSPKFPSNA